MNTTAGLASAVAMVPAIHFGANPETAKSNAFQSAMTDANAPVRAAEEQETLARSLSIAGVSVVWLEPPPHSRSPDGVFPNNWFSTHEDGRIVFYPMEAPSRRGERITELADQLRAAGFAVTGVLDYSARAESGIFLEGTGSLVLDRINRVAYLCPSSRTDRDLAEEWAEQLGFRLQVFTATDPAGRPVYHTNVIMSLGAGLAIMCFESISDPGERAALRACLEATGQEVLEISWKQVCSFAGNQLFLKGREGPVLALSKAADDCLRESQRRIIDRHAERVAVDIATIERHGGGSVRCMLAEIFLPRS